MSRAMSGIMSRTMSMRTALKSALTSAPLAPIYGRYLSRTAVASQSDEGALLATLAATHHAPRSFIEFGFHPREYNCASLEGYTGLLIDGDPGTVRLARQMVPRNTRAERCFLTLDNLSIITEFADRLPSLGILSVDVDGNDYWFLDALLPRIQPHIVVAEYNASFGHESVTVPYAPTFDRHGAHSSGWYHGASLSALALMAECHGYGLVATSAAGGNAFFVRGASSQRAANLYRENALRNQWSGIDAAGQWARIKGLPLVEV